MPAERACRDLAIHASAVAIGGRALVIRGPSRSGKSRLAAALVGASTPQRPIVLLGDDRILLRKGTAGLVARPHPRIAGFIERRGLGIVAMPFTDRARVGAVVDLGPSEPYDHLPENFPRLRIVIGSCNDAVRVLDWWDAAVATDDRDLCVTPAPESGGRAGAGAKN